MPLFGHRHQPGRDGAVRPAGRLTGTGIVMPPGWQPQPERPFGRDLADAVQSVTAAMYGTPVQTPEFRVRATVFTDAFGTAVDGRRITVGNGWTPMDPAGFRPRPQTPSAAVCAVEISAVLPLQWICPARFRGLVRSKWRTGNPAFDRVFAVQAAPAAWTAATGLPDARAVLTPPVQQRLLARDDWAWWAGRGILACISPGAFGSAAEVSDRVRAVLDLVTAIPAAALPGRVEHAADGLLDRLRQVDSMEGAIALLRQLTPAEREVLARSGTPLSSFADVQTPQQAIARFQALNPGDRMQILAMFTRDEDR